MKKAIVAGAVAVVALAGAVVAIADLDPARFAPLVEAEISRVTGQPVTVRGPVSLSLFPDPAIAAADIVSAGAGPIAIRVERVRVQLSWRALLRGDAVARGVQAFAPHLDVPAEAASTLAALALPPQSGGADTRSRGGGTASRFEMNDGRVRLVGAESVIVLDNIALRLIQTETGRREVAAAFVVAGLRSEIDAKLQPGDAAGSARFEATFQVPEADLSGRASGQVAPGQAGEAGLGEWRLAVAADAKRLGEVLAVAGVTIAGAEPPGWSTAVRIDAEITGSGDTITVDPVMIDAGGQSARGRATVSVTERRFEVEATLSGMIVEHWLGLPGATAPPSRTSPPWGGSLTLTAPLFTTGGQVGRDGALVATLADRQWTVSRLAATLPGQADLAASGFVRLDAGEMVLDGAWSLSALDPRGFFSWLGVDTATVQAGRLAVFDARGTVLGNAREIQFGDLAVRLDNAIGRGRAGLEFGERMRYRLDLSVDQFVMDPYRDALVALLAAGNQEKRREPETMIYGVTPPPDRVTALATFDADLRLDIQSLIAGDSGAGSGAADLGLTDGRLSVRSLSLKDVGGVSVFASGAIANLGTVPTAEGLEISLAAADHATAARAWPFAAASRWAGVFPLSARATLNGPQLGAALALTGTAGSAEFRATGTLAWADGLPRADLEIAIADASPAEVLHALTRARIDAKDAKFEARGKAELVPSRTAWSDVRVALGNSTLMTTGKIETQPGSETFTINFEDVTLDWPGAAGTPATTGARPAWPESTFAPFWPPTARGSIRIAGPLLAWRGLRLTDFAAVLSFDDNTLELSQWRGDIFGGPAQVQLRIDNAPRPAARLQVLIDDAKPGEFFAWLGTAGGGDGTVDLALGLTTDGPSPRAWISRLSGSGSFKIETLQRQRPTDQSGPLGFLTAPAAAAGASAARVATGAAFRIVDSKLSLQDGTLTTNAYSGPLRGEVDFAAWRMSVVANLRAQTAGAAGLRLSAEGAPDAPTVKVDVER